MSGAGAARPCRSARCCGWRPRPIDPIGAGSSSSGSQPVAGGRGHAGGLPGGVRGGRRRGRDARWIRPDADAGPAAHAPRQPAAITSVPGCHRARGCAATPQPILAKAVDLARIPGPHREPGQFGSPGCPVERIARVGTCADHAGASGAGRPSQRMGEGDRPSVELWTLDEVGHGFPVNPRTPAAGALDPGWSMPACPPRGAWRHSGASSAGPAKANTRSGRANACTGAICLNGCAAFRYAIIPAFTCDRNMTRAAPASARIDARCSASWASARRRRGPRHRRTKPGRCRCARRARRRRPQRASCDRSAIQRSAGIAAGSCFWPSFGRFCHRQAWRKLCLLRTRAMRARALKPTAKSGAGGLPRVR